MTDAPPRAWAGALASARTVQEVGRLALTVARRRADADGATFVLRDGDLCFYVDEDAIGPLWRGQRFPMSQCISGWAMAHDVTAVVGDAMDDDRIPVEAYRPTFVRSVVMVPMSDPTACRTPPPGALGVYWARRGVTPDDACLAELRDLAAATGQAVRRLGVHTAPWAPNFAIPGGDRPPVPVSDAG